MNGCTLMPAAELISMIDPPPEPGRSCTVLSLSEHVLGSSARAPVRVSVAAGALGKKCKGKERATLSCLMLHRSDLGESLVTYSQSAIINSGH